MLTKLELTNFRSYARFGLDLAGDTLIIFGPNGSGKTNLLESVYVACTTKSFRARDEELVSHGQDFFKLGMWFDDVEVVLSLQARPKTEKILKVDGVKQPLARHIGRWPVSLFEPYDLILLDGPPEKRRRYLDAVLSQTEAGYLSWLSAYRRALRQRNALLEAAKSRGVDLDQLFLWDVKLSQLGEQIARARRQYLDFLVSPIRSYYAAIAGEAVELELGYSSAVPVDEDYESAYLALLQANLGADQAAGFTTRGVHRDDFNIKFNGQPVGAVASRGETRTVVLALKLSEVEYIQTQTGRSPLLLLDDVFSELDTNRRTHLVSELEGRQAIITSVEAAGVAGLDNSQVLDLSTVGVSS